MIAMSIAPHGVDPFAELSPRLQRAMANAMRRIGAKAHDVARWYAPISPSTTLLRKFKRVGGRTGTVYMHRNKDGTRTGVTLTEFYAANLARMLSPNKRGTRRPLPGMLQASINFTSGGDYAEVFVPSNSPAGSYAKKIHDEKGFSWFERGPGTQAKGPQADAKFIERAIADNQNAFRLQLEGEVRRAIGGQG